MQALKVTTAAGEVLYATDLCMVPQAPILLAQVLAANTGVSREELIWIGSPAWVIAGAVSNSIVRQIDAKMDERRVEDVRRLVALARAHGQMIPDVAVMGLPTGELSSVTGYGPEFDLDAALPMRTRKKGFFGGGEGTFAGIAPSRERKAREIARDAAMDYIIDPWADALTFCDFKGEYTIAKSEVLSLSHAPVDLATLMGKIA